RTLVCSLGSCRSTIELHPHAAHSTASPGRDSRRDTHLARPAFRPRPRMRESRHPLPGCSLRPQDQSSMSDTLFAGRLAWNGHAPDQPFTYESFDRATRLEFVGGAVVNASAPGQYRGDDTRANPETLMLGSLMQCHFLTFMAVAAK